RRVREGNRIEGMDLFGPSVQIVGAGLSKAGRPRLPMRLMISLLYLKHAFDESDEGVVDRWGETPSWQHFSGMDYYEHRRACDPTVLVKFRKLLGEQAVEELLAQTINAAVNLKLIDRQHLTNVIVDSTVAPKAVAYPTDSRLLQTAREKLVAAAKDQGIALKQTYAKEGSHLRHKAGRYAHARQFKRMRRVIKRQRTIVGRLARQIQTKATTLITAIRETLGKANRLFEQTAKRKTETPKLYSWHAPEVVCMSKGKARTPYEFGSKVGIATTLRGNLIVGARAFDGNPYDGHTLAEQIEQATILMQDTGMKPGTAWVDLGYRGVEADNPDIEIKHRGKKTRFTELEIRTLKRRQAIEPVIGHLKVDHRMGRCHLKGALGDDLLTPRRDARLRRSRRESIKQGKRPPAHSRKNRTLGPAQCEVTHPRPVPEATPPPSTAPSPTALKPPCPAATSPSPRCDCAAAVAAARAPRPSASGRPSGRRCSP
ncbi:MAG: IS5 family transposase, partial [Burkholderiales bacterium]|nr:IS5 family transposase [Burkholderiales bacterium]